MRNSLINIMKELLKKKLLQEHDSGGNLFIGIAIAIIIVLFLVIYTL